MKITMKSAVTAALGVMLLVGIAAGGVSFAQADQPAAAAQPEAAQAAAAEVTVSASGTVRLVPDKASVSFGVTTQEETADLAQTRNSEAVDKVIAVLTERGVEEKSIRTTGYSMYPQYDYSDAYGSRIVGYVVRTSMTIQDQDIEDVGKLLADCVEAGINNVDNVAFLCSGYDEAYHRALTQAVENARLKAGVLADAAGKSLGDAVSIVEGWQDTSAKYSRQANVEFAAMDAVANGPALMPGESEINANVTVTFRMQ